MPPRTNWRVYTMWDYIDPEIEYLLGQPLDWYTTEQGDTLTEIALHNTVYLA